MAFSDYPPYQLRNLHRTLAAQVPQKALRDLWNQWRYGPDAPLSDECLFVRVRDVTHAYASKNRKGVPQWRRRHSGCVRGGDWDQARTPIEPLRIERAIRARYIDGADWEETELFDHARAMIAKKGVFDECRNMDDVRARYRAMDRIADEVRLTGRFRERRDVDEYFRREHGGILVHIDRNGAPLRSGGGQHRFALARVLGMDVIPVQVGVVHLDAVTSGAFQRLRRP